MKKSLTVLGANALFLLTMFMVITLGSAIQLLNLSLGLIVTEVLLIALPALLFLRGRKIPLKEGLRLNPIRPLTALLCVLLGFATFMFSILIEAIMAQLTGMASVPLPEGSLPKGVLDSILYFIALAAAAPICEEIMFRGAIQGAYEKHRPAAFAILITAVMFAFYHFRVSGLPALLPVAFILGYVAWRTHSIYASMLIHFGMNATSGANTLFAIHTGAGLPFLSLWTMLAGIPAAAVLIFAITRLHPTPAVDPAAEAEPGPGASASPRRTWLGAYWPLLGAILLYLSVAGLTVAASLPSRLNVSTNVTYYLPRIEAPVDSRYQVTDRSGKVVGELTCRITPQGSRFSLDCTRTMQAYEVKTATSYYSDVANTTTWRAVWDSKTIDLLEYSFEKTSPQGNGYRAELEGDTIIVTSPEGADQALLTQPFLVEYEWPWRANMVNAGPGVAYQLNFGYLLRWDEKQKKSVPTLKTEYLQAFPPGTLDLPAGHFDAWKISLAGQAAWYTKNDPGSPRPIQFDDGMLTYSLVK